MSLSTGELRWTRFAETPPAERKVNVFWQDSDSGRLAVLAAYLCTRDPEWRKATIRVISLSSEETDKPDALREMLEQARIDAEIVHIPDATNEDIVFMCSDATLALMPMRMLSDQIVDPLGGDMISLAERLPMTAAIHAAEPIHLDTDPESGRAFHIAEAEAIAEEARQRLRRLERQLKEAAGDLARASASRGWGPCP